MAMREHTDPLGRLWLVWSVTPTFKTTRSGTERRQAVVAALAADRRKGERRGSAPPDWVNGWLCFETKEEKRRLAPVPARWEHCGPEELEFYRNRAVEIRR